MKDWDFWKHEVTGYDCTTPCKLGVRQKWFEKNNNDFHGEICYQKMDHVREEVSSPCFLERELERFNSCE